MATLVMTIDSDSEVEAPKTKRPKKSKETEIVKEEDEEILLGHTVILDSGKSGEEPTQAKVGSHQQWKFTDVLQVDAKKDMDMEFETGD